MAGANVAIVVTAAIRRISVSWGRARPRTRPSSFPCLWVSPGQFQPADFRDSNMHRIEITAQERARRSAFRAIRNPARQQRERTENEPIGDARASWNGDTFAGCSLCKSREPSCATRLQARSTWLTPLRQTYHIIRTVSLPIVSMDQDWSATLSVQIRRRVTDRRSDDSRDRRRLVLLKIVIPARHNPVRGGCLPRF